MTIMVLEIKIPETIDIDGVLEQTPNIIAYIVSFVFLCTGWYNQNLLFKGIKSVNKKVFWSNCIWILCISFIPVGTGWVSRDPFARIPEYAYFFCFVISILSYDLLIFSVNDYIKGKIYFNSVKLKKFKFLNFMLNHLFFDIVLFLFGLIGIYFIPILGVIITILSAASWIIVGTSTEKVNDKAQEGKSKLKKNLKEKVLNKNH